MCKGSRSVDLPTCVSLIPRAPKMARALLRHSSVRRPMEEFVWQRAVGGVQELRVELNLPSCPSELGSAFLLRVSTEKHSLISPSETFCREQTKPCHAHTSDLRNCELISGHCLKSRSLWQLLMQEQTLRVALLGYRECTCSVQRIVPNTFPKGRYQFTPRHC